MKVAARGDHGELCNNVTAEVIDLNRNRFCACIEYAAHILTNRGLTPIPHESPYANLKYVSIRTARYDDEPLLIGGKGAGVEMTAAGVVGDLIGLVREVLRA